MSNRSANSHSATMTCKKTNDDPGRSTAKSTRTTLQHTSRLPSLDWAQWRRPCRPRRLSALSSTTSTTLIEPPLHTKRRRPKRYNFLSDPFETTALWEQVHARKAMPQSRESKLPRSNRGKSKTPIQSLRSSAPSVDVESDAPSSALSVTTVTDDASCKDKKAKATTRDADFEASQLKPRGISIVLLAKNQIAESEPQRHFGTAELQDLEQAVEHYVRKSRVSTSSTIWVPQGNDYCSRCALEFQHLKNIGLPEREYEVLALETVLLQTRTSQLKREIREAAVIRMVGPSLRPRELWEQPPLLEEEPKKSFQYDIYPDCQYYLSPQLISMSYRARIHLIVDVTAKFAFLPYLSVEFKCDGKSVAIVRNQIAAAASISLYNRYQLKVEGLRARVQTENSQTTREDWTHVRHYGLSIESTEWTIWMISPTLSDNDRWAWHGCTMKKVTRGYCDDHMGFAYLASWVNEIHLWAYEQYGPDCEHDLKWCLERSGTRTSLGTNPQAKAP